MEEDKALVPEKIRQLLPYTGRLVGPSTGDTGTGRGNSAETGPHLTPVLSAKVRTC